jgi:hypothetical protein
MKLKNISKLDEEDLLGLLGLEQKASWAASMAATLGTLGVGLLIGVGIGFLLAPKAGRGLREDIRDRFRGTPEILARASSSQSERAHRVG